MSLNRFPQAGDQKNELSGYAVPAPYIYIYIYIYIKNVYCLIANTVDYSI